MKTGRNGAFTLIELLVVIAIVIILASIATPVFLDGLEAGKKTKCVNNLRQMGIWVNKRASTYGQGIRATGGYPAGGESPAQWDGTTYSTLVTALGGAITQCPSMASASPIDPRTIGTCSYAYVANLRPTYDGGNSTTSWKLYWSGCDYAGDLKYNSTTPTNLSNLKSLPLADNLELKDGLNRATYHPTVPAGLDLAKYRTQRTVRQVPENPEDVGRKLPIMMDMVVIKIGVAGYSVSLPASSDTSWKATSITITKANKNYILLANHCNTSASSKKGWGANVCYSDGSVQWKEWEQLRFQVMYDTLFAGASTGIKYCFFY